MDWMTMAIMGMGAAIFCVWVIIPIREYRSIYLRLRRRRHDVDDRAAQRPGAGAPVNPPAESPKGTGT